MKFSPGQRRHLPFYVAVVIGLLALSLAYWLRPGLAIEASANAFFLVYLILSAIKMPKLTARFLEVHAAGEDEPIWVIFAVTFGAVVVAVTSLFLLINDAGPRNLPQLSLSLASVGLGWFTIHTMAALHYAHLFWRPEGKVAGRKASAPHGGLDFPGTTEPCGYDFLYFALVIGMTAQTSDVAITSTMLRKVSVLHGVVSFFFNTVLVAAAVNFVVSMGS